jgi:hypothetical protein
VRRIVLGVATLTAALALAGTATASEAPMPQLDAFASEVAGKPVHVWCEDDWAVWDQVAYSNGIVGHYLGGFTNPAEPVVYVNPSVCEALQIGLVLGPFGYRHAGLAYYAQAILVLAHEAVHQRGIDDEAQTECTALPLAVPMAAKHLRLPMTVSTTRIVKVRKKINGRWMLVPVQRTVRVANPDLPLLQQWITVWHRSTPAEYQVGC